MLVNEIVHKLLYYVYVKKKYLIMVEMFSLKSFFGNCKNRKGILSPTFILHDEMIWY